MIPKETLNEASQELRYHNNHLRRDQVFDMMVVGYPAIEARPKLLREDEKMIHYDVSK